MLNSNLAFSSGVSALGLSLNGDVDVTVSYTAAVTFGLNSQGFYVVAPSAGTPLLNVTADAWIPSATMQGHLGPLVITATDLEITDSSNPQYADSQNQAGVPGHPVGSLLNATFNVGMASPGKVYYLGNIGQLVQDLQPSLSGNADILLGLSLGLDSSGKLPSVSTNFVFRWNFTGEPTLAFNRVQLNMGSFVSALASNLLNQVQNAIAPMEPILNFLTSDLPLLDDVGVDLSLMDLPSIAGYADVSGFFTAVESITSLINTLSSLGSGYYDLGSFQISGPDLCSVGSLSSEGVSVTQAPDSGNQAVNRLKSTEKQTTPVVPHPGQSQEFLHRFPGPEPHAGPVYLANPPVERRTASDRADPGTPGSDVWRLGQCHHQFDGGHGYVRA